MIWPHKACVMKFKHRGEAECHTTCDTYIIENFMHILVEMNFKKNRKIEKIKRLISFYIQSLVKNIVF